MLFVATCLDKPQSLETRKADRPAHLACLDGLGRRVKVGGALLAEDFETPIGSMIVFEGASEKDVLSLLSEDPYSQARRFQSVSVRPRRPAVGQTLA